MDIHLYLHIVIYLPVYPSIWQSCYSFIAYLDLRLSIYVYGCLFSYPYIGLVYKLIYRYLNCCLSRHTAIQIAAFWYTRIGG